MKILVCISHVPDTTTKIIFKENNTQLDDNGVQWIINPWDELALTRALELKEASGGAIESVVVANVGLADSEPTIRKALAIGADSGIRVNSEPKDAYSVAVNIGEALKEQQFDIIMCGIESSDYNNSAVGGMLAEVLNINAISAVSNLEINGDTVNVKREIDGGFEIITAPMPLLTIVQKGIAVEPRIPSMRGIMSSRTKPIQVIEPAQVESLVEYPEFDLPESKSECKMIDSENIKELVDLLHNEAKVI